MATKSKNDQEAQSEEQQSAEAQSEEQVAVVLNPETGLLGYTFSDGFSLLAKKPRRIGKSRYDEYSKEKHERTGQKVISKV